MTGDLVSPAIMSVPTLQGPTEQAWVDFDDPQFDGDGDGPYQAGMIDTAALTKLFE
ncbi:MAG: hypothetical protein ABI240_08250 [Sphingomonas sp.]